MCGLVALVPLKRALFWLAAGRWMVPIISGDIHRGQRNTVAAAGAVIVVAFQGYDGNTRLRTAIGTTYKSFTSCHTRISFPSRAQTPPEKAFRETFAEYLKCFPVVLEISDGT
jgi:hypothetical protein